MDDSLKHKYAPRRNKRYAGHPSFEETAKWAETLDWRNNDAHFFILAKRVMESIDDELREKHGRRIDQVTTWEELLRVMREAAGIFTPQDQVIGIFIHLRLWVRSYVGRQFAASEEDGCRAF